MVVLSRENLINITVDTVICPIKNDFMFETYFSRQVKEKFLSTEPLFFAQQFRLGLKNLKIGTTYHVDLPVNQQWVHLCYLVVQDFFHQITFDSLCDALSETLLKCHNDNIQSVVIPFLSLGFFDYKNDVSIIKHAILEAYHKNNAISHMKIIINNINKNQFDLIIEEFESLPKSLYRKPKFFVNDSKPYKNRKYNHDGTHANS